MEESEEEKDPISCALSIMRRMPPNKIEHNLSGLLNLIPEHTDELSLAPASEAEARARKDTKRPLPFS